MEFSEMCACVDEYIGEKFLFLLRWLVMLCQYFPRTSKNVGFGGGGMYSVLTIPHLSTLNCQVGYLTIPRLFFSVVAT